LKPDAVEIVLFKNAAACLLKES